ncbi:MAG: sulfatase [Prolixibacteraceae bacterium]
MNQNTIKWISISSMAGLILGSWHCTEAAAKEKRPNILFAIADDQSYPYASAYGTKGIHTPAFDEVAKKGVLFTNAFVAAPQCSPSRAAILTGKNIWQLEEAGTHSSYFPKHFQVFPDLLEQNGYSIGYTGKPWGPGNWKDAGWSRNPTGPEYNSIQFNSVPASGISKIDYFENFKAFYSQKQADNPFFFWYGGQEPHRDYEEGSGLKSGKKLQDAVVPSFLPNFPVVQSDILDHILEIEWFDAQLGKMIRFLEEKGELDNTIVVVTADNGMPFPSAKANLYEYGTHVPLAICRPGTIPGNRVAEELVGLIDLAPTFLDLAGVTEIPLMSGQSLSGILLNLSFPGRQYILTGRERHSHARPENLGYPSRAIRTRDFLYILNIKPDRWPAGDPASGLSESNDEKSLWPGYHDIDNSPTKLMLIENRDQFPDQFRTGYEKRPAEELYDVSNDPGCTRNLADNPQFLNKKNKLRKQLKKELITQGDPRMTGKEDLFESYPRFGSMRNFPGFKERGTYNPNYQ